VLYVRLYGSLAFRVICIIAYDSLIEVKDCVWFSVFMFPDFAVSERSYTTFTVLASSTREVSILLSLRSARSTTRRRLQRRRPRPPLPAWPCL